MVGLEIKREAFEGELSSNSQRILPIIAAIGGMVVPALIYVAFNINDAEALRGWAIPSATDIAFALAVLLLLGPRIPTTLKTFLIALAIIDDLGAVLIIALFYSGTISTGYALGALVVVFALAALNYRQTQSLVVYCVTGAVLWFLVYKSGIHGTLAGVLLAAFVPLSIGGQSRSNIKSRSPLTRFEHALHVPVGFLVVPLFGFANAGLSLSGTSMHSLMAPVTSGVIVGLFLGKVIGVFGAAWLTVKVGIGKIPSGVTWMQLFGVALLCGIGFTMSLFIGSLAFNNPEQANQAKLGVLVGSLMSGMLGYLVLRFGNFRLTESVVIEQGKRDGKLGR